MASVVTGYVPTKRDKVGVVILNGVARLVVSRSYRNTLLNVVIAGLIANKPLSEQRDELMRLRETSRPRDYERGGYPAGDIWPYTLETIPPPSPGPAPGAWTPRATAPAVSDVVEASLLVHLRTCDSGFCRGFNNLIGAYEKLLDGR